MPAPVMLIWLPMRAQGPDVVKVTVNPDGDAVALMGTGALPYCTFANCGKLMVCETVFELAETIMNVPDTGVAALYAVPV